MEGAKRRAECRGVESLGEGVRWVVGRGERGMDEGGEMESGEGECKVGGEFVTPSKLHCAV